MTDCLVWNAGGIPVNLAAPSINTTITGSPTSVLTASGPAGYATGGAAFNIPDHGNYAAADFAIRVLFRPVTWPNAFTCLFDKGLTGNRELALFVDTSGNVSFTQVGNGSIGTATTGMTAGGVWDFVLSRTGTTASYYVNGVFITSNASSNVTARPFPLSFGANPSGGGANGDTQYLTNQIWNRGLSASEVAALYADPYGFLIPAEGEMPALYVAPAAPVVSSRQYIVGPGVYVSETGRRSYMLAPGVYVTETISAVTAPATQYAAFSLPQHSLSQVIQKMIGY